MNSDQRSRRAGGGSEDKILLYTVSETPPVYLCILLGLQQYLTAFASSFSTPLILAPYLCMEGDTVGIGELISTVIFSSGISTIIQTVFGVRLPIVQSISTSFLIPIITLMSLPTWKCPYGNSAVNQTSLPIIGSDEHKTMWKLRLAEIQGAIILSSILQVLIGISGSITLLMKFIGPLTITPTITIIGLSLVELAASRASTQWWIALLMVFLTAVFSQYMGRIQIPCFDCSRQDGFRIRRFPMFNLLSVLLALALSWILCLILTETGVFPDDPKGWGYQARTDIKSDVLQKAQWFRFPYPGQYGTPTFSVVGMFGMVGAVIASTIESVGDYFACANIAGAPPPPGSAVARGIVVEGLGGLVTGIWGGVGANTSYSQNIGAIGITKVGSRAVIFTTGVIMVILACFGKFGALFATVPDPVIGGLFIVMCGMIAAVGLSNLQYVDLRSVRNLFVLGVSLFLALSLPRWVAANADRINTGSEIADQLIVVLCGTSMLVAGVVAAVLDNTIPGTDEERGIKSWRNLGEQKVDEHTSDSLSVYNIPFFQKYINKAKCSRYVPICPGFVLDKDGNEARCFCCKRNGNAGPDEVKCEDNGVTQDIHSWQKWLSPPNI